MGNDSTTAFRTREQLRKFLGIFSPRSSKHLPEFLGHMLFGIQTARDTLVSEIARSLQEDIFAKKTQERLEHHLQADGLDDRIHGSLLCDAASSIHEDTLIIIDPTDVQKPYAEKMPYLAKVWDGSKGKVVDRILLNWGGKTKDSMVLAEALARQCTLRYEDGVLYKSHNKVHNIRIKYGSMPARLPVRPEAELHLVVVKWPKGEKPMMLLTTLDAVRTRKALWEVVQGYITRWRVEETIRYIKQSHRLKHMRLLDCQRLKNMAALVVAVSYFAAAWLGRKVKLEALANHVAKVSRKMYKAPEFFYYAIADGLRWLFVCHGRWRGLDCVRKKHGDLQMEFELLSG